MDGSFSGDNVYIRYVLPVVWITLYLPIMARQRRRDSQGQHRGSLMSKIALFFCLWLENFKLNSSDIASERYARLKHVWMQNAPLKVNAWFRLVCEPDRWIDRYVKLVILVIMLSIRSARSVAGLRSVVSRGRHEARVFGAVYRWSCYCALLRHRQRVRSRVESHRSPALLHSAAGNSVGEAASDWRSGSGN